MLISVVIPHFNQEDHLRTCLERLLAQKGCSADVEIIVVDNGSRRMPEAVCADFPAVHLLSEVTPGPGPARNRGARVARGNVLAFIDADCHADPGWLATIEATFADPATQIIGGDVRVGYAVPGRPSFIEPYEAIYSYRNNEHIAQGYSGTGNLATRPDILRHVGPFAGIEVAEDYDWGLRAGVLGYQIRYVAEMIVYHPARASLAELTRKWDRHIAHDYRDRARTSLGTAKWLLKALALLASPLAEVPTIIKSPRISGEKDRLLAFSCLCAVRGYRSYVMFRAVVTGSVGARSDWER
jgi:glycosyltransferase involved in cell wall biosynthesis